MQAFKKLISNSRLGRDALGQVKQIKKSQKQPDLLSHGEVQPERLFELSDLTSLAWFDQR